MVTREVAHLARIGAFALSLSLLLLLRCGAAAAFLRTAPPPVVATRRCAIAGANRGAMGRRRRRPRRAVSVRSRSIREEDDDGGCVGSSSASSSSDVDVGRPMMTFSIVPESSNPSGKSTRRLLEEALLPDDDDDHDDTNRIGATTGARLLEEGNGGRVTFRAAPPPDPREWARWLSPHGVRSLRLAVCDCRLDRRDPPADDRDDDDDDERSPSSASAGQSLSETERRVLETLRDHLPRRLPWEIYIDSFGNAPRPATASGTTTTTMGVSCRRWASFGSSKREEVSSTRTKHALRELLVRAYGDDDDEHSLDDCEFTLLLYGGDRLRLEWTVLVRPRFGRLTDAGILPNPGCKRVEAWMMVKNAEEAVLRALRRGKGGTDGGEVLVLDPLCGKATFLVEAATAWKTTDDDDDDDEGGDGGGSVAFVGIDASEAQLRDAHRNVEAVTDRDCRAGDAAASARVTRRRCHRGDRTISLCKGDSRDVPWLEDGSVTAIVTCPPFGRQFHALGTAAEDRGDVPAASYREWLREWSRLLAPDGGVLALLIDAAHTDRVLDAIAATTDGTLRVTIVRDPFRLGRVTATAVVAEKKATSDDPPSPPLRRFPWEGDAREARAGWARLRTASLPGGLEPFVAARGGRR